MLFPLKLLKNSVKSFKINKNPGLITGENGKNRLFLRNLLEKDESFNEISREKSLNWLRMWKEIVFSDEKPRFLFYLE